MATRRKRHGGTSVARLFAAWFFVAGVVHGEDLDAASSPEAPPNGPPGDARPPAATATVAPAAPPPTAPPPTAPGSAPVASAAPAASAAPVASAAPAVPGAPPQSAAASDAALPECRCVPRRRRPAREPRFELSFGSAELFTNQSVTDPAGIVRQRVIPITALDAFGEYLLHPRVGLMVQFLLPLEPESTLIEGELAQRYVPPALSAGVRGTAFGVPLVADTVLEAQLFLLGGTTLGALSGDAFYPTLGWRAHLGDERGFTMYVGTSFAFRQSTTALIYGVGHRF